MLHSRAKGKFLEVFPPGVLEPRGFGDYVNFQFSGPLRYQLGGAALETGP